MAGRPRMEDGKTELIAFRASRRLAAAVDEARGEVSRPDWLRALAESAVSGALGVPVELAREPRSRKPRAAPVTTAISAEAPVPRGRAQCDHRNWGRFCSRCCALIDAKGYPA